MQDVIKHEITVGGKPMSLARFMELGLLHPQHGYYSTKEKIFNKGGDFVTSPEISQMFGESLGIWMVAALQNNYGGIENPKERFTVLEMGPGSGLMMSDILRTIAQLLGSLKNIDIILVEPSANLAKQQQERLLDLIQKKLGVYLSYDIKPIPKSTDDKKKKVETKVDRFRSKEHNFSITWYSDLPSVYNDTLENSLTILDEQRKQMKDNKNAIQRHPLKPMFVIAHELYDALPIHQFKYLGDKDWCEKVIKVNDRQALEFTDSEPNNDNVVKVLQPKKFFSEEALQDLKVGDTFEICPEASNLTK